MGVSYETYLRNLHSKLKHSRQKTHEWNLTPEELVEIWVEQGDPRWMHDDAATTCLGCSKEFSMTVHFTSFHHIPTSE